jgi:uncharacterized coiled-coil protein SlyX
MLAQQNSNIEKAVFTVHTLTQDERFRQQCEAREDFPRQQIDHDAWFENKFKEQEATIAEQASTITELRETVAKHEEELEKRDSTITTLNETVSNQGATITTLQTSIEELREMVATLHPDNK